jgi:hypothetical protein
MKTLVPRREIKMYTLLSTFPLHDKPADYRDSVTRKAYRNKFEGNAIATRDVTSSEPVRIRKKPSDRKISGQT